MGYIEELRALVGTRPLIMPGTVAVIRNRAGEVLFIRRGDFGNWSLPGGMVELGQSVADALVSEVRDETGLSIGAARPVAIYSDPRHSFAYPNGDQVQPVTVAFLVESWSGESRPDGDESLEVAFFPPDQPPDCHPFQRQVLADAQRFLTDRRFLLAPSDLASDARSATPMEQPSYIHGLRPLLGHRPIVTVGVRAVIRDAQGRVLLMRRGDFGYWSLPGGLMELGQSAAQSLAREVREETGLVVLGATPFALYSHPRYSVTYPNGDRIQPFAIAFLIDDWAGTPRPDGDESLDVAFFPVHELPEFHTPHRPTLTDLARYLADREFIID